MMLWLVWSGSASGQSDRVSGFLGFDRNDYPGDAAMADLRKEFAFSGYWLTPAPGGTMNSWAGKRKSLEAQGYGFALLARGRPAKEIRNAGSAQRFAVADAQEAARGAKAEGFASGAIIFLDIEDGGRLAAPYHAYLRVWADQLLKRGYRPGVYCSGIVVDEGGGTRIVTADDIRTNESPRKLAYWVFNDACPPSPGCVPVAKVPQPSASGVKDATVWQFTRSPRERETAARCSGYAADGNCYAAADAAKRWHLDMNVATSSSPSFARQINSPE
jgi:hypothetical protein